MLLQRGDSGDSVKVLQRGLNKLGEMVLVDGEFGMGTAAAVAGARGTLKLPGLPVADDAFQAAVLAAPDPFPPLTAAGVTFIAREEVSDGATYRKKFQRPCLPPAPSGITIGIGYDCQFTRTEADLVADWGDVLSPDAIALLVPTLGKVGTQGLLAQTNGVLISLGDAMRVFAARSLPKYLEDTRRIYPQVAGGTLNAAQRTALVSLVYNRGTDLTGDRRTEMKAIQGLLAAGRLADVPAQFESMTRLWTMTAAPGLILRRRREAILFRGGFAAVDLD